MLFEISDSSECLLATKFRARINPAHGVNFLNVTLKTLLIKKKSLVRAVWAPQFGDLLVKRDDIQNFSI